jgi:hypothetical protein
LILEYLDVGIGSSNFQFPHLRFAGSPVYFLSNILLILSHSTTPSRKS